jgi:hypothetical protein
VRSIPAQESESGKDSSQLTISDVMISNTFADTVYLFPSTTLKGTLDDWLSTVFVGSSEIVSSIELVDSIVLINSNEFIDTAMFLNSADYSESLIVQKSVNVSFRQQKQEATRLMVPITLSSQWY